MFCLSNQYCLQGVRTPPLPLEHRLLQIMDAVGHHAMSLQIPSRRRRRLSLLCDDHQDVEVEVVNFKMLWSVRGLVFCIWGGLSCAQDSAKPSRALSLSDYTLDWPQPATEKQ